MPTHLAQTLAVACLVTRRQLADDSKAARTAFYGDLRAAFPKLDGNTVDLPSGGRVLRITRADGSACPPGQLGAGSGAGGPRP